MCVTLPSTCTASTDHGPITRLRMPAAWGAPNSSATTSNSRTNRRMTRCPRRAPKRARAEASATKGYRIINGLPPLEHVLRDRCRGHRGGPAGVEGEMGDQFGDLVLGHAVVERALDMADELRLAAHRHQRRDGDQ